MSTCKIYKIFTKVYMIYEQEEKTEYEFAQKQEQTIFHWISNENQRQILSMLQFISRPNLGKPNFKGPNVKDLNEPQN